MKAKPHSGQDLKDHHTACIEGSGGVHALMGQGCSDSKSSQQFTVWKPIESQRRMLEDVPAGDFIVLLENFSAHLAFLQHINCFYLVLCLCRLISDFVRKLKNVWPLIPLHCCLKDLLYSLNWSCHMQAMSPELHTFYTSTEGAGTCCSILLNDRCRHSEKCSTSVLCRRRRNQTCKINCFFPLCICGDLGASVLI